MPPQAARKFEPDTSSTKDDSTPNQPQGVSLRAANDNAMAGPAQASNDNESTTNSQFSQTRNLSIQKTPPTQPKQPGIDAMELRKDAYRTNVKVSPPENDNPRPRDAAIREAKKNTPWVPQKADYINPSHPSTDQVFNDSYTQAGLQPSVGTVAPMRDVNVTYGKGFSQTPRTAPQATAAQKDFKATKKTETTESASDEITSPTTTTPARALPKRSNFSKLSPAGKAAKLLAPGAILKKVSRRVSMANASWVTASWLGFQIPLATVSVTAFGLMFLTEYTKSVWTGNLGVFGNIVAFITKTVYNTIVSVIRTFSGIDLTYFEPTSIFFVANSAVLFFGWGTMFALLLIYTFTGTHALSGKGQTLKIITFIMAFALYFPPILNFVPWALFWVLVVYIYPE